MDVLISVNKTHYNNILLKKTIHHVSDYMEKEDMIEEAEEAIKALKELLDE